MNEIEFKKTFLQIVEKHFSNHNIQQTNNTIIINGKTVSIDNLYKTFNCTEHDIDLEEYIIEFISDVVNNKYLDLSWDDVIYKVRPRINSNRSLWNALDKDKIPYVSWVNDCSIIFVIDYPDKCVSIDVNLAKKWKVTADDLFYVALENLEESTSYIDCLTRNNAKTVDKTFMIYRSDDGYDSARILLSSLWKNVSIWLGYQFLVSIPSRDMLCMAPMVESPLVDSWMQNNKKAYKKLPYPITPSPFVVTLDGVAKFQPWSG